MFFIGLLDLVTVRAHIHAADTAFPAGAQETAAIRGRACAREGAALFFGLLSLSQNFRHSGGRRSLSPVWVHQPINFLVKLLDALCERPELSVDALVDFSDGLVIFAALLEEILHIGTWLQHVRATLAPRNFEPFLLLILRLEGLDHLVALGFHFCHFFFETANGFFAAPDLDFALNNKLCGWHQAQLALKELFAPVFFKLGIHEFFGECLAHEVEAPRVAALSAVRILGAIDDDALGTLGAVVELAVAAYNMFASGAVKGRNTDRALGRHLGCLGELVGACSGLI